MGNSHERRVAFFGTATYAYNSRYSLTGTVRYEGSNRLGKSRSARWLPTWNVSASYDMTNEPFMAKIKSWLSQLKLRGSYSLTADTGPSWVTNATAIYKTDNRWGPTASTRQSEVYIYQIANTELT